MKRAGFVECEDRRSLKIIQQGDTTCILLMLFWFILALFSYLIPFYPLFLFFFAPCRHEELLVQGGLYATMWMKQQKNLDIQMETQKNNQTEES